VDRSSHPHERWFVLARAAAVLVAVLSMAMFVASLPAAYTQLQIVCTEAVCADDIARIKPAQLQVLQALGLSLRAYAIWTIGISVLATLVYWAVGGLIFWRRPDDRVALLFALFLIVAGSGTTSLNAVEGLAAWQLPVTISGYVGSLLLVVAFYLFPDGRWVSRWTRWAALVFAVSEAIYHFQPALPFGLNRVAAAVDGVVWPGSLIAIVIAQAYRYRYVSTQQQRQQTKWVVFGLALAILALFVLILAPFVVLPSLASSPYGVAGNTILICSLLLIPLSFGMAILRSRLYDIDVIIRRTLIYSVLTALLATIYISSIVVLQVLLRPLVGQESELATVASTLAIAALFQPLRRRVQAVIDRRFFRRKYDAQTTVQAFSARLREETDLETLEQDIYSVVRETLQPAHVSLWVRDGSPRPRRQPLEAER